MSNRTKDKPLLEVHNLRMEFSTHKGIFSRQNAKVKAVSDVSLAVHEGETFGLVGESGCGKTTVGRCILRVYKPTAGQIIYRGVDITQMNDRQMHPYRREMQMIFQDPYGSLDPRQSVGSILREAVTVGEKNRAGLQLEERVNTLLELVELDVGMKDRYPHEMSGGQRQRLGIARALACDPRLIVCDEPVSALDVSIQAQIINLFKKLQRQLGLTYLFIAHDLAVVRHISDRIAVMYLGRIVEITDAAELYLTPLHPYTQALLSAIPVTDYDEEKKRTRITLQGEVPSPIHTPSGCPFHPRCPYATEQCRRETPRLRTYAPGHEAACHKLQQEQAFLSDQDQ